MSLSLDSVWQPLVEIQTISSTVEMEIGEIIPDPPGTVTTSSATSTTTTGLTSPLNHKDMMVSIFFFFFENCTFCIWKWEKMVALVFFSSFQAIYSKLIGHERMQLVDEMYSIRQDVRMFNQWVDTFCQNVIHYQMMLEMGGVQAPAPPDDVAKLSLHV